MGVFPGVKSPRAPRKHPRPQVDVARLLGVKPNQIVEMENARKTTTLEKLFKLCEHYNVSADYLLGLIDDPKPLKMEKKEGQP